MDKVIIDSIMIYLLPRKIKIFVCYSEDVVDDVNAFRLAMADMNRLYPDTFDVDVDHWKDNSMIDIHNIELEIQDIFDKKILNSDYVVFLFHNTFGKYTMHEWNLCAENKKRKPHRLLGLKQNAYSKYTFDEMLGKLQCKNKIVAKKYENISEFIAEVRLLLLSEVNMRFRYIKNIVKEYGSSLSSELFDQINSVIIKDMSVLSNEKYHFNRMKRYTKGLLNTHRSPLSVSIRKYDRRFTLTQISQGNKCRGKVRHDFLSELEKNVLPRTLKLTQKSAKVDISYTNPDISCNEGPDVLQS